MIPKRGMRAAGGPGLSWCGGVGTSDGVAVRDGPAGMGVAGPSPLRLLTPVPSPIALPSPGRGAPLPGFSPSPGLGGRCDGRGGAGVRVVPLRPPRLQLFRRFPVRLQPRPSSRRRAFPARRRRARGRPSPRRSRRPRAARSRRCARTARPAAASVEVDARHPLAQGGDRLLVGGDHHVLAVGDAAFEAAGPVRGARPAAVRPLDRRRARRCRSPARPRAGSRSRPP